MQIKLTGQNAQMRITMDDISNNKTGTQAKNPFGSAKTGDMFGPQCKVTISREGRKKSAQEKERVAGNILEAQTGRLLMREQQRTQENKDEVSGTIDEIAELMQSLQNAYQSGEDKETIQKKQDALNKMIELKKRQEEENKQSINDAVKGLGVSKEQEEIDRKNEELLMILESFEDEEEDAAGTSSGAGAADTKEEDGQVSQAEQITESASVLGASAARRELAAKGAIEDLRNDGHDKLAQVNEILGSVSEELELAREAAAKEGLSDDERRQLVADHVDTAKAALMSNYGEMKELRKKGLQEIKDARELDLKHIKTTPLDGVKQAKQAILDAGAAAALTEAASGLLNKASEELEERVQEALDERNDITQDTPEEEDVVEEIREKNEEKEAEKEAENQIVEKEDGQSLLQKNSKLIN